MALKPNFGPINLLFFTLQPISANFLASQTQQNQIIIQVHPEVSQDNFQFDVGVILANPQTVLYPLNQILAIFEITILEEH